MHKLSTLAVGLRRTMQMVHLNIVSFFILTSLIFFVSCSKELAAPEPLPLETGLLSVSKNEVVLDADKPGNEAVTFSWATDKNSLIKYTLILTSGNKSDSIAVTQNTVKKIFTNSELNTELLDKLGLAIGVTVDLQAQIKAVVPLNGKTAESNVITIKVTPSQISLPPNLIQGGKFNAGDESKWTALNISPGVTVSFTDGKAQWKGGSWGHAGIYQAIQVEANKKYQLSMNVSGSGASDTWFEIYVGKVVPQQGQDYNDGGKRLALNTWNGCGKTPFDGPLTEISCEGTGGVVQFSTAGTVYLVIRGGGDNLGTTGISVDNVELRAIQTPNLVQGGKFDAGNESKWAALNLAPGVTVSFADGKALWKGGSWGHAGIYQAIQVEANQKYQLNMDVSGSGASDTWFEIYVGKVVPQQGQDYNDGGKRLALNTWNGCGKTPFDGPLTELSCEGTGKGVVQFSTAGTVYLVIRGGGDNLGTTGISVDNVELRAIQ